MESLQQVGIVIIGRNEGQNLKQCLLSALRQTPYIVYVDSGSTDGSIEMAKSLGVYVVELDLSVPFNAARARNEGFYHLLAFNKQIKFVQFVDGDCEIVEGWITQAQQELEAQPQLAIACGRRRERFPEQSIYNKLCDIEWNTPIGFTDSCGGDFIVRIEAFQQVNGFNSSLIAGEEPELCVRLRQKGWKILRVDGNMTLHDAHMTNFSQWWKRSLRAGHAYAEGCWLHGRSLERHWVRESRSIWVWGLFVPLASLGTAWLTGGLSLLLLIVYPIIIYRSYSYSLKQGFNTQDALIYALFCVLGKFPGVQGQIQFYLNNLSGNHRQLIEYKN
jgi:glycosyltransferase involved in cell wall biosynthesis